MIDLRDEEKMLLETVRRFAKDKLAPRAPGCEQQERFDAESWDELSGLGLAAVTVSEENGGMPVGFPVLARLVEELSSGSAPLSAAYLVHCTVAHLLDNFGTDQQKQKYLPGLLSGQMMGALAISEPGAGSDVGALATTAHMTGGDYLVKGQKVFITSGGLAGLYVVLTKTGQGNGSPELTALLVEPGWPGFSVGRREKKMGQKASPTTELYFEELKVPGSALIGQPGQGLSLIMDGLNRSRVLVAATAVGLARAAYEAALDYTRERKQFGRPLVAFQGLRWMLADMAILIETSRRITEHAAQLVQAGRPFIKEAAMAKAFATDAAMKVTTDAVQLLGGYGYMEDYPVERYMREAKLLQIVEGTNQIQREVIAKEIARS
ncbi:MAG: acyl-CoA dehydrogenase family protein [Proteobacteria bacterium]|nr:acyl-CoA dehydrogenase family protein [Pseudomonadota bacterium]MBU2469290.1 acyl-CoA dehydrogenase family protein [Pseudomonadota bacterium]MBU2518000.1 acyl-CoA dehydrogenase family protein [Pseudomonadota bacterium]